MSCITCDILDEVREHYECLDWDEAIEVGQTFFKQNPQIKECGFMPELLLLMGKMLIFQNWDREQIVEDSRPTSLWLDLEDDSVWIESAVGLQYLERAALLCERVHHDEPQMRCLVYWTLGLV